MLDDQAILFDALVNFRADGKTKKAGPKSDLI